jgi:hypothetical protein
MEESQVFLIFQKQLAAYCQIEDADFALRLKEMAWPGTSPQGFWP